MADINKDRSALFTTIYKIATDLVHAGYVAEWDFKSYVLVTMRENRKMHIICSVLPMWRPRIPREIVDN